VTRFVFTFLIFVLALFVQGYGQHANVDNMKRYTKVPSGYLMVLKQGDSLFEELEKFAKAEAIPSANFTGMGFVDVTFGFFDFKTKKYNPKDFQSVELSSMHGTIAWKQDEVSIHAHGVVGDKNFQAFAGHILGAIVSTGSVEVMILPHDKRFQRQKDESIGADVLNVH
jgi:predicted DNA-binding protein with PD1-like motif